MERSETVYNDYLAVKSTDGTWNRDSLQLIEHVPNPDYENDDDYVIAVEAENICARAVFSAYMDGLLDNAGFIGLSDSDKEGVKLLDLALRASDLPDWLWDVLFKKGQVHPCIYSGCVPVSHHAMRTYRSNCGCVGSSWETILIEALETSAVSSISSIRRTYGTYAAALAVLKTYEVKGVDTEIGKIEGLAETLVKYRLADSVA